MNAHPPCLIGAPSLAALIAAIGIVSPVPSDAQTRSEPAPTAQVSTCASAGSAALAVAELRICGELGVRAEFIANEHFAGEGATRQDDVRFRGRVRVRAGAEYRPSETVSLGLRLSSGDPSFPSSAWSSFSDDFRRKPIQIDRAFARWRATRRIQVVAGLQPNPLFTATELLWDSDVHPAGLAESVSVVPGLTVTAGQFMLREVRSSRPANEENSFLLAQGIVAERRWGDRSARLGASYYWFTNPDELARSLQSGELDAEFKTNRFDLHTPGDYFSDFNIVQLAAQYDDSTRALGIRLEATVNTGARRAPESGAPYRQRQRFGAGGEARYGRLLRPGDWLIRGGFYHVEADAVVAVYTSDDFQQTNVNVAVGEIQLRLPGGARLVSDTYIQKKIDTALASNGGIVLPDNAPKIRSRLSILFDF